MTIKAEEDMMTATLHIENSNDASYFQVKKNVENDYFLGKTEFSKIVVEVQIFLKNLQPTVAKQSKSHGPIHIMF